jgi:hypothetical protein
MDTSVYTLNLSSQYVEAERLARQSDRDEVETEKAERSNVPSSLGKTWLPSVSCGA